MSRRRRRRVAPIALAVVVVVLAATAAAFVLMRSSERDPVVRRVAIEGRPSAVAVAAGLVWVTDDGSHAVHVVDPDTSEVVGEPIEMERNPIAIDGDAAGVWVAHASGSLVRIDARSRRTDDPIDVGGSLTGVAVTPDAVWVTDIEAGELVEVDPDRARVVDRVELPDGVVRVDVAGDDVWVTGREGTVTKVPPRRTDIAVANVGVGPIGVLHHEGRVFVANSDDDSVTVVGAEGAEVLYTLADVGRAPVALAPSGELVLVANQEAGTVTRLDPAEQRVVEPSIDVGTHPRGAASDGRTVWIVGTNPSRLVRVDPQ